MPDQHNLRARRALSEAGPGVTVACPGPHTVGEIAKDLGRSAVGNALTTLADRAEANRITGKPLRYEANSATAAAAAIAPKAPAPPKPAPAPCSRRAEAGRPEGPARPGRSRRRSPP